MPSRRRQWRRRPCRRILLRHPRLPNPRTSRLPRRSSFAPHPNRRLRSSHCPGRKMRRQSRPPSISAPPGAVCRTAASAPIDSTAGPVVSKAVARLELGETSDQLVFAPELAARPYLRRGSLVEVPVDGWNVRERVFLVCHQEPSQCQAAASARRRRPRCAFPIADRVGSAEPAAAREQDQQQGEAAGERSRSVVRHHHAATAARARALGAAGSPAAAGATTCLAARARVRLHGPSRP